MSIWSKMGLRDGKFIAVNPLAFMDGLWEFFLKLRIAQRTDNVLPPSWEWQKNFSFAWRVKSRVADAKTPYGLLKFSYTDLDYFIGTFISPECWCATPEWDMSQFWRTEEDVLQEEIVLHPLLHLDMFNKATLAEDMKWQHQRYALIQRLRFMIIPMACLGKQGDAWVEISRDGYFYWPCLEDEFNCYPFHGHVIRGIKLVVPDYWAQEGVSYKIGIVINPSGHGHYIPLSGAFWHHAKEFVCETKDNWDGYAEFSAFAVVDLSTHPDFAKFYDAETINCPDPVEYKSAYLDALPEELK